MSSGVSPKIQNHLLGITLIKTKSIFSTQFVNVFFKDMLIKLILNLRGLLPIVLLVTPWNHDILDDLKTCFLNYSPPFPPTSLGMT